MFKSRYTLLLLVLLVLASCSKHEGRFVIEGTFRGFNQGELYVYGIDGKRKLDTVGVNKGQFEYRIPLEDTITLVIMFPNFSEIPVFAESGADVKIEGDANHLKEIQVKGTPLNEQMTTFRLQTSKMTPPEVTKAAESFIHENPESPASRYILDRYIIRVPEIDYAKARELIEVIRKACPDDERLALLSTQFEGLAAYNKPGSKLPAFTATDLKGRRLTNADLKAKVNVITLWATWNHESMAIQNLLLRLQGKYESDLKVVGVCLDADPRECRRILANDSVQWSTVCDGQMWLSPILQKTGLCYLPDNILVDAQGKIIAHTLNYQQMTNKLRELLEKPSP